MSGIIRRPSPLPTRPCDVLISVRELWEVRIYPDRIVDPKSLLPEVCQRLLNQVAADLTGPKALLLWLVRCQFNAGSSLDDSLAFHEAVFGEDDSIIRSCVQGVMGNFNRMKEGDELTEEEGWKLFNSTIEECEESVEILLKPSGWSLSICQTFLRLACPVESAEGHLQFLLGQTYDFCIACMNDPNYQLRPIVRFWYARRGPADAVAGLSFLMDKFDRMQTQARFDEAFRLVVVVYFSIKVQEAIPRAFRMPGNVLFETRLLNDRLDFTQCVLKLLKEEFEPPALLKVINDDLAKEWNRSHYGQVSLRLLNSPEPADSKLQPALAPHITHFPSPEDQRLEPGKCEPPLDVLQPNVTQGMIAN